MRRFHLTTLGIAAALICYPASAEMIDAPKFSVPGLVVVWGADQAGDAPIVSDFIIAPSGSSGNDTISGNVASVVTGTLTPAFEGSASDDVPSRLFNIYNTPTGNFDVDSNGNGNTDVGDTINRFALTDRTNIGLRDSEARSSFYVASNTAFNIDAQALRVVGRNDSVLGKIYWDMEVARSGSTEINFGANAQLPHSSGPTGGIGSVASLLDMLSPQTVFTGNQRTAASRGTLVDQSVRFDVTYVLGSWQGYSLHTRHTNLAEGVYEVEAEVVYTVWVP
ncbi:MAG: hypothetical protein AAF296_09980 [Pseudomonadota bacterium]